MDIHYHWRQKFNIFFSIVCNKNIPSITYKGILRHICPVVFFRQNSGIYVASRTHILKGYLGFESDLYKRKMILSFIIKSYVKFVIIDLKLSMNSELGFYLFIDVFNNKITSCRSKLVFKVKQYFFKVVIG